MASAPVSVSAMRETMDEFLGPHLITYQQGTDDVTPALARNTEALYGYAMCSVGLIQKATRRKVLLEISRLLNTGLDMETLSICVRLCEQGINPEALSSVIKELRRATDAMKASENMAN